MPDIPDEQVVNFDVMNEILEVKKGDGTTSHVVIGHAIDDLHRFLPAGARVIIITDTNVYNHYKMIIERYEKIVIGMGEEIKTFDTLLEIYSQLLQKGADRETYIVGFGGGIVTDITGFAASTYMRGLRFGFVATSLLAQVDASVGGKNGVNFEGYKNMIGTFNQPDFVLCDLSVLRTLPKRELQSGMAEIIKSGLILDSALFELFERHDLTEFLRNDTLLREAITGAVKVKKHIVDLDEKETGDRKKLNLGHTFAHAIEKCTRKFLHGEAVAIGLVMIAELSVKMGLFSLGDAERVRAAVTRMGLPTDSGIAMAELFEALKTDKKKDADSVSLILMRGIGECEIRKMKFADLEKIVIK